MTLRVATFALGLLIATAPLANADRLRLVNGAVIEGTYLGGDTRSVKFMGPDGTLKTYSVGDVAAIEFVGTAAAAAPAPAPAPAPAASPAPSPSGVSIPAGTEVVVRMIDNIDSKTTGPGERFRCSIDDPVMANGQVVVQRGADCTVQIMRAEGGKELAIKLYDITVNGRAIDTVTNYAEVKAQGKGGKTAKRAAIGGLAGAGIGALIGGGKGAAIGAGAGAGAGAISVAAKGSQLNIPSETRLGFVLRAPMPL
jgi:hypothetical protein